MKAGKTNNESNKFLGMGLPRSFSLAVPFPYFPRTFINFIP